MGVAGGRGGVLHPSGCHNANWFSWKNNKKNGVLNILFPLSLLLSAGRYVKSILHRLPTQQGESELNSLGAALRKKSILALLTLYPQPFYQFVAFLLCIVPMIFLSYVFFQWCWKVPEFTINSLCTPTISQTLYLLLIRTIICFLCTPWLNLSAVDLLAPPPPITLLCCPPGELRLTEVRLAVTCQSHVWLLLGPLDLPVFFVAFVFLTG